MIQKHLFSLLIAAILISSTNGGVSKQRYCYKNYNVTQRNNETIAKLIIVMHDVTTVNISIYAIVNKTIKNLFARVSFITLSKNRQHVLINQTLDMCKIIGGSKLDFFTRQILYFLENSKSLPKKCPIMPGIYKEEHIFFGDNLDMNIMPRGPVPMEKYAVIVWLHSGDFSTGSPNDFDPFPLVFKQKVIVVTVSFRLNIFGFLCSMDGESPGNFGLMDQSAALQWIKENIKLFGGNDNLITLMGHGSGSVSAGLHLTSGDWSEGTFHKAIMMSGNPLSNSVIHEPMAYMSILDAVASTFECYRTPTSKLLECLRSINDKILVENIPNLHWGPVIDMGLSNSTTPFITQHPKLLVERGAFRHIPILIGYTNMEEVLDVVMEDMMETGITTDMYETLITETTMSELSHFDSNDSCVDNIQLAIDAVKFASIPYPPIKDPLLLRNKFVDFHTERNYVAPMVMLANAMSQHTTVYGYRFDIKSQSAISREGIPEWVSVPHNYDLIFIWGMPYWSNQEMVNPWDSTDKRVADIVMTLWVNFVKFSNPTQVGLYIRWDNFTAEDQQILIIDRSFNMSDRNTVNFAAVQFWNNYYPKVMHFATQCCNVTDSNSGVLKHSHTNIIFNTGTSAIITVLTFFYLHTTIIFT